MHILILQFKLILLIILLNLKYIHTKQIIEKTNDYPESIESNENNKTKLENESASIVEKFFIQKLDHFNLKETRTWKMRYFSNQEFFKSDGPILIYVGGEWNLTTDKSSIDNGNLLTDIAKETNSYLVYLEHRYYGESQPFKDLSIEHLKYLSIDQSLEDLLYFIETIKKNKDFKNSKVILVGCSYAGSLVTWFMDKYPNVVAGGWASSAPLSIIVDFSGYMNFAEKSLKYVSTKCYDVIRQIVIVLDEMLSVQNITKEFNDILLMCDDFNYNSQLDRWTFFEKMADVMLSIVQDNDYNGLKEICNKLEKSGNSTNAFEILVDLYNENSDDYDDEFDEYEIANNCSKYSYNGSISRLNSTKLKNIPRAWQYQICTQVGWFQPTSINNTIFGSDKFPIELGYNQCKDLFGIDKEQLFINIANTRKKFSNKLQLNNIIWTNGQLDPWKLLSKRENPDGSKTEIPRYSHCGDFSSISENDTLALKRMKLRIKNKIINWIETDVSNISLRLTTYNKLLLSAFLLIFLR